MRCSCHRLIVSSLLFSAVLLVPLGAAEPGPGGTATLGDQRIITIANVGGVAWECTPPGSTDISASESRFSELDASIDHLLRPAAIGNQPPVVQDLEATVDEDSTVVIDLIASDPDGDDLSYAIATQPQHGVVSVKGGRAVYSLYADHAGTDRFSFTASDGSLTSREATVSLTITAVPDAPRPRFAVQTDGLTVTVDGSGTTDVEGDALVSFAWDWGDGTSTEGSPQADSFHPYAAAGTYRIILHVTDATGLTGSSFQEITVSESGSIGVHHAGLTMISLPGGSFQMGEEESGDAKPIHEVTVSSFHISSYEVTSLQVAEVMNWAIQEGLAGVDDDFVRHGDTVLIDLQKPDSDLSWNGDALIIQAGRQGFPAGHLTWHGAQAFCAYVNIREGLDQAVDLEDWSIDLGATGYRLPTEAEWEYAARGGLTGKKYPWGDTIDGSQANFADSGDSFDRYGLTPVGSYEPNAYGLYDVVGNAAEWCADWYGEDYYQDAPATDPKGPASGSDKVYRGGTAARSSDQIRVGNRFESPPNLLFFTNPDGYVLRGVRQGFRPVRGPGPVDGNGGGVPIDPPIPLTMKPIPGGSFQMGEPEHPDYYQPGHARPIHAVNLSPYEISAYEVTNWQFVDVMNWAIDEGLATIGEEGVMHGDVLLLHLDVEQSDITWNGSDLVVSKSREDFPVCNVDWFGAQAFCAYVNVRDGLEQPVDLSDWSIDPDAAGYRLPTEAEWEFAARGGLSGKYFPLGDEPPTGDEANFTLSGDLYDPIGRTPVGLYFPNGYGLYDLEGNVLEWCADWYAANYYRQSPADDPIGPATGSERVVRGGSLGGDNTLGRCARRQARKTGLFYFTNPDGYLLGGIAQGFRPVRGHSVLLNNN